MFYILIFRHFCWILECLNFMILIAVIDIVSCFIMKQSDIYIYVDKQSYIYIYRIYHQLYF